MSHFPIAAGGAMHVPLAIVDDLRPGTAIEIVAAAEDAEILILDVGILEVSTGG